MTADEELGYVYVPLTALNDYGGYRPGQNLFASSLVCLDAKTGKRVWHFQMVHHDIWDYDNESAPVLGDITVNGRRIKAVMQPNKNGFLYVFDRVTGEPVWPIEELPVPQSTVPGEQTWPTQPFPTKPPAFDRQGLTVDDLIDFTPELRAEAIKYLEVVRDRSDVYAAVAHQRGAGRKERHVRESRDVGRVELAYRRIRPRDRHLLHRLPHDSVSRRSRQSVGSESDDGVSHQATAGEACRRFRPNSRQHLKAPRRNGRAATAPRGCGN